MAGGIHQGDLARLLMQHRTSLYGYIFACVRHHADAEDILQTTTVAVMESGGQLRDEAGFLPWAREIARRRVLAHRRGHQKEQVFDPELVRALAEAAERVDEKEPANPRQLALKACLDHLPPESRRLIIARYDPKAGDADALAKSFGHSVQSVYARIKRIKVALRNCVEKRLEQEPEPG